MVGSAYAPTCMALEREMGRNVRVKHIAALTKENPAPANAFQDIICEVVGVSVSLVGFKGGQNPPAKALATDKCDPTQ